MGSSFVEHILYRESTTYSSPLWIILVERGVTKTEIVSGAKLNHLFRGVTKTEIVSGAKFMVI